MAIGFEDGDGDPQHAVIGRRGTASWTLRVKGTPAHSSQIFREDIGYGAVFEAARILDAFRETLAGRAAPDVQPGADGRRHADRSTTPRSHAASAFGKDNVIPEQAVVTGDLRALSKEQFAPAQQAMTAIVGAVAAAHDGDDHVRRGLSAAGADRRQPEAARALRSGQPRRRRGPVTAVNPDRAGAADVSFVAGEVPMIIDGIGMRGDGGHTVNETADLSMFPAQISRAAVLLYRLSRADR